MARKRTYRRRSSSLSIKKILAGAGAGALMPGLLGIGLGYYLGGLSGVIGAIGSDMIEDMTKGVSRSFPNIKVFS